MKRTFGWWLILISCILASCGSDTRNAAVRTSTQASTPLLSTTNVATLDSAAVQGRLLVVQRGTIWLWQGAQGQPLVSGDAWQPAWSPDGSRIAYITRSESASDIAVADSNGAQITTLTANASQSHDHFERARASTWAWYPAWSPDGTAILFAGQFGPPAGDPAAEFNMSLYRTSAAHAGEREQVLADSEAHCGRIATAPNGSVVYVRAVSAQDGTEQIYRYEASATAGTPFPGAPPESYDPAFSPDGAWLAFAAHTTDGTDIWLLPGNAATATPLRLTVNGRARAPAFSPDGKQLAFLAVPPTGKGFELWVADLAYDASGQPSAGTPQQITQDMNLDADSGISWAK